jgi:hypothetical protein
MDFKEKMDEVNEKFNHFVNFVTGKLKDFPNLTIGEQISYPAIGLGIILIIVSLVMFAVG